MILALLTTALAEETMTW